MYDIIGTLYTQDEDPVAMPGWHVNSPFPVEGWEQYLVTPNTPRRVFAGHQTFCYQFPSQEVYEAIVNPPLVIKIKGQAEEQLSEEEPKPE